MSPEKHFTPEEKERMVNAIREAEKNTSGEIRVHFENHCKKEVLDCAAQIFAELKMHKTAQRNGILIYIALEDKKVAVIGDIGINSRVPINYWEAIKDRMIVKFREGRICEGVCEAVLATGQQLKEYFPYEKGDINELPDDISFKK